MIERTITDVTTVLYILLRRHRKRANEIYELKL